jgi:uncharacterized protein (DUF111 family)
MPSAAPRSGGEPGPRRHLFERLAEAEAAIHGTPIEKVHLHEVGALDSIIDIVGAVYWFDCLGIDDIVASPLNVGGGMVQCAHGDIPVPAPATARCSRTCPSYGNGTSEMVTPTGALLVTVLREVVRSVAHDEAGVESATAPATAIRRTRPNVLRILQRRCATDSTGSGGIRLRKIECEIDDMNPQLFGPLMDKLLAAGALDVF